MLKYFYNLFDKVKEKLTKKGQGMVEYALILAAVAVLAGLVLSDTGGLRTSIESAFTNAGEQIKTTNGDLNTLRNNSGGGGGGTTEGGGGSTEGGGQ